MNQPRPVLLDLFCCAGGASMGFSRAGFDVVGIDKEPQPDYPFPFLQMDALEALRVLAAGTPLPFERPGEMHWLGLRNLSAVALSPPCQWATTLTQGHLAQGRDYGHVDLLTPSRPLVQALGLPYVLENVVGARPYMRADVTLCGLQFGLRVFRHRLFELGGWDADLAAAAVLPHPTHRGHRVAGWRPGVKHEGDMLAVYGDGGGKGTTAEWQSGMGIEWTSDRGLLAEAIPPAYTEHLGRYLLQQVQRRQEAGQVPA